MKLFSTVLLAASITTAAAQTTTKCSPLNTTCPPDPALGTHHQWFFNETMNDKIWDMTNGEVTYTSDGAEFTIDSKLESPTMKSTFYIFFGTVESHVKMARGAGIVSSVVLESDDLDEIDWEWVGANTSEVQTNFYGKGKAVYTNGGSHYVPNADTEFHNYTTHWTPEKLEWWVDGSLIRTLQYAEAKNYPQTPSKVQFGVWPAGDPSTNKPGTIKWAGGVVDYDAGPYTMVMQSVNVHDFHSGKQYVYTDHSGSFESIKVVDGNSTVKQELNKPPPESIWDKWEDLPTGAKVGVGIGAAVVAAMLIAAFFIYCIRQRRRGRREHALNDTRWESERTEMNNYQAHWHQSDWQHKGYQQVQ